MASISKLQIQGMRSFGPDEEDRQTVQFFNPLTLILGQNGCGKTTIIECLKYVTTGDPPPGAGRGGSFVHDPKMARESAVKGQVKLAFNGIGNTSKIICRSIEASQKAKTITVKTLDSTITDRDKKVAISSKCADINNEIFNCFGISKPILNYVIFCHQEDSNWPLDEGSKVKEKFDEIFNSAKYKKCLNNIKTVRKSEMAKAKMDKNDSDHYKTDKQYADSKANELKRKEEESVKLQSSVEEITKEMDPLRERYALVTEEEKGFSSVQMKLAEAETSLEYCHKERESLENLIKEIIPDNETDEEIESKRDGLGREAKMKEASVNSLTEELDEILRNKDKVEKRVQKNAASLGKAFSERDQHDKNVKDLENLKEEAEQMSIFVDGDSFISPLRKEESKIKNQIKQLKSEHKRKESEIDEEVDTIKAQKAGLQTGKKREQSEMMSHKREIAQLKRQLNDLEGAADKLEKIKRDWNDGQQRLEAEKAKVDTKVLQEEITEEKKTITNLETSASKLREESRNLEEKQSSLQRISHLSEEIDVKETKMKKILSKRNSDFLQLFGDVPDSKRLRVTFKDCQEKSESQLKEMETRRKKIDSEMNGRRITKKDVVRDLDKKSSKVQQLKSKIGDILGPDDDIETEISKVQDNLTVSRKELQVKEAGKFTYSEMIDVMKAMSEPACPTCHREFHQPSEAEELIVDLNELIKSIPNKVKSLESKVSKLSARLETLQRIRPDVHTLKQTNQDVAEGKAKLEDLDKEIKKYQDELEEQEEDWNITEVNVSLFKQVSEDVQTVDSIYKELAQLQQKKTELTAQCGELVGSGSRNLETVREEEEQTENKLKSARRNLDQCQDTLNKHTSLLNSLEASQNKLTNRKLEIEGQQQQRATTMAKKDEMEEKTKKCTEEVQRCDRELGPVQEKLETVEEKKSTFRRNCEEEVSILTDKERELDKLINEVVRLEKVKEEYTKEGKADLFEKLKTEKKAVEDEMKRLKEEGFEVDTKITQLKEEISSQENRRRLYDDNLKLRNYKIQEEKHKRTVRRQQQVLEDMDWKKVEKKKNDLAQQINQLGAEKSAKGGQIEEVKRSVKELQRELQNPKLRDAAKKFKEMSIKHNLRVNVAADLNKYYIALNWAILNFHKEKMKAINKIIRELWKSTYRGNDIDYIEIKTDDGDITSGADKKATYSYRVVMVKNDTEMDMRGRCSAGQKVLSSLIIRLALAESFSSNCGIIALDEPTTNLDRENIESLAQALSEIVTRRAAQSNFQLVVITHDEDFIEQLSRCGELTHYQKVSRNAKGLSEVRRYDISSLDV